jgi:hypothetical protein
MRFSAATQDRRTPARLARSAIEPEASGINRYHACRMIVLPGCLAQRKLGLGQAIGAQQGRG